MATPRQEKMREFLRSVAAQFFLRESGTRSLVTVTDATISPDFKYATIYITTFPTSEEVSALEFAKRKRTDLREYLKQHSKMRTLPVLEIRIDEGERNRQRIDELTQQG
jgi:ribosome-binding factor A